MTHSSHPAEHAASVGGALNCMIALDHVSRRFADGTLALDDISLDVPRGSISGIIGRSGAGKSTLLRLINGLETASSGDVRIEGQSLSGLAPAKLRELRRRIGMIFQSFGLLSSHTVAGNVALPLELAGMDREAQKARVAELLARFGLSAKAQSYPALLSGGERQRVGIARALATRPDILLCDEATSALDPETTRSVLALLGELNRELGLTIVLITHEMSVVRAVCDHVAVLDRGHLVDAGPVDRVFADARHEATVQLLGGGQA